MLEIDVPPVVEPQPSWNATDLLLHRVQTSPDAPLFSLPEGDGWRDVTSAEFLAEVKRLAKGFVAAGIEPGDHIAFMAQTSYEWTLVDFSLWFAGAVMVPIYETSSASQIAWIVENSEAKGIIVQHPEHVEKLSEEAATFEGLRWRFAMFEGDLDALRAQGESVSDDELESRRSRANGDDIATLIYTSGSTGRPKGCVLTHANFVELSRNTVPPLRAIIYPGASTLLFITLAHVFARFISVLAVYGGVKVGHQPDTTKLVPSLGSFRPTFLLAVPRVFEKVYNSAEHKAVTGGKGKIFQRAAAVAIAYSRSLDEGRTPLGLKLQHWVFDKLVYSKLRATIGGRVEHAVSGSAPLGDRLGHFYRAIGIKIMEGYGLTETTAPASVNLPDRSKIGTVGPPIPGVGIKIGDDSEVLVRGINVFREYWKNPEATSESFIDGWFRTGDMGTLDDDGYLTITGRTKEIIVTAGGKNVSPAALEDPVRAHPLVNQIVVIGDRRPFISAMITLDAEMLPKWLEAHGENPDMSVSEAARNAAVRAGIQQAIDRANKHVSRAESIREFVVLDDQFTEALGTLTPKLSIRRHVILDKYADVIEGIYDGSSKSDRATPEHTGSAS